MAEETSQPTNPPSAAVDTSLPAETAPVVEVAPTNTPTNPPTETTPPPQATATPPSAEVPGTGGEVGGGVDTKQQQSLASSDEDPAVAYRKQKEAFLRGETPPEPAQQTAPAPSTQQTTAPATNEANVQTPQPGADDQRVPKVHLRPADAQDLELISDWKKSGGGKPLRDFILERYNPKPQAPAAGTQDGSASDGTQTPAVQSVTLPDGNTVPTTFTSVQEIDSTIKKLLDAKYAALENFEPSKAREFEIEQLRLQRLRDEFGQVEQVIERTEQTAFQMTWDDSLSRAKSLFPDAGKPGSALESRAIEIRKQWVETGHPLAHAADSALPLYAEAAASLNVAPAAPSAAPPAVSTPPSTSSVHRPPTALLAGGDARTVQPSGAPEITTDNYFAEKARLLGRR